MYRTSPEHPGSPDLHGFIVLSEDDWNTVMHDSVVVPVYLRPGATASVVHVPIGRNLFADCTRVISLDHGVMGERSGSCSGSRWDEVRIGVRVHLDIDRRVSKGPKPAPAVENTAWWPKQDAVQFAQTAGIVGRKLYAAITDDDWNAQPGQTRAAFVKLTSRTKAFRERREVAVSGGWVVCGDIYQLRFCDLAQELPGDGYPAALTPDESSSIARNQRVTLTLR